MSLLAIDLGLRTGLACYRPDGRLAWYRSSNLGDVVRLRKAIPGILDGIEDLQWLALEGGGTLAQIWRKEAERRQLQVLQCQARDWRRQLLLPRRQRSGIEAKRHAGVAARRVIDWSRARKPTALRHDAAEAILTGLYAVMAIGWLDELPAEWRF